MDTYVLVFCYYDPFAYHDILHAGTEKQCLKYAESVWADEHCLPYLMIKKADRGKVYTPHDNPSTHDPHLLLLKFTNPENKPLDNGVSTNNPDWLNAAITDLNLTFGWINGLNPQLFYQIGSPPMLVAGTIDIPKPWEEYHTSFISDYLLNVIKDFKNKLNNGT